MNMANIEIFVVVNCNASQTKYNCAKNVRLLKGLSNRSNLKTEMHRSKCM